VGLGLNRHELESNSALHEAVLKDLNRDPVLPFSDGMFDAVINTVSVDYLTRPFEVFSEVGRVLRPGGLFLVIFSNRMFPQKAVRIWKEASDPERAWIVEDYFRASGLFDRPHSAVSQGMPRPEGDRWSGRGIPSDPVHAVWAERSGGDPARPRRPEIVFENAPPWDPEEVKRKKESIAHTHRCPYCDSKLGKWEVPQTPFTEWDAEHLYICFNDSCPYLLRGWQSLGTQGIPGMSYRLMYNPSNDRCYPVPIYSLGSMKDGIVDG
jgi:SAM-dependent methyltransferase